MVCLTDGGPIFAKNSDRDPNESQLLSWHAAQEHKAGSVLRCSHISIPQVGSTYATLLSRPWWHWGAEMGANEHGLVIGNQAVFSKEKPSQVALTGMDLVRLALERTRSVDEAIEAIVSLIEAHGQGGPCSFENSSFTYHNSFILADRNGAAVLETVNTQHAVEHVQNGSRSISNGLSIPDFKAAHADRFKEYFAESERRSSRTQQLMANVHDPAGAMAVLRDHGGGHAPQYRLRNGALNAPSVHAGGLAVSTQTTSSWVSDLRSGIQHWTTATSAPSTSIFKPVAVDEPVELGTDPTHEFSVDSLWWRHEPLHRTVMKDPVRCYQILQDERDQLESDWIAQPPVSAEAFMSAENLERKWLKDCLALQPEDRRPWYVRRIWNKLDRDAGINREDTFYLTRPESRPEFT